MIINIITFEKISKAIGGCFNKPMYFIHTQYLIGSMLALLISQLQQASYLIKYISREYL